MASVRFNLKRPKDRRTAIVAIVRHNGKKYSIGTGQSIDTADWDTKRERSRTDHALNGRLAELRKNILSIISENDRVPTRGEIKAPAPVHRALIVDALLLRGQELYDLRQSANTRRHYANTAYNITKFTADTLRHERRVDEITAAYISAFSGYLNTAGLADSTIRKYLSVLNIIVRLYGDPKKCKGVEMPEASYSDQVYLTTDEIGLLEAADLNPGSHADMCRDQFLAGYYTALRSCDWKQIRSSQIETTPAGKFLRVVQQKTKGRVLIPANPKLLALLAKHGGSIRQYSNQVFNREIKKVCYAVGICDRVSITEYRRGQVLVSEHSKCDLVSSHTARRSFATNAILAGIPATDVMRFTGHKSMSAFLRYVRTSEQEVAIKYFNHPFFLGQ